jgi:hypothetical protein
MEPAAPKRLLRLAETDNVGLATSRIDAGEVAECAGQRITLRDAIGLGHKVAIVPIMSGQKVIKFGCPIGTATRDIAVGEHVHTHNLASDYLPTYTLDEGHTYLPRN